MLGGVTSVELTLPSPPALGHRICKWLGGERETAIAMQGHFEGHLWCWLYKLLFHTYKVTYLHTSSICPPFHASVLSIYSINNDWALAVFQEPARLWQYY